MSRLYIMSIADVAMLSQQRKASFQKKGDARHPLEFSRKRLVKKDPVSCSQPTRDWACGRRLTGPSSDEYQTALKRDRQSWLLEEPCLRPDLVVTPYDISMQGVLPPACAGLGSPVCGCRGAPLSTSCYRMHDGKLAALAQRGACLRERLVLLEADGGTPSVEAAQEPGQVTLARAPVRDLGVRTGRRVRAEGGQLLRLPRGDAPQHLSLGSAHCRGAW